MAVTMRDVAKRAGVSPTVVSHVLHNKAAGIRVSPATAERVRQAAADLAYRVNVAARNFRERQTMLLGVLHGLPGHHPRFNAGSRYFAALMDGIVDGAFAHGYTVGLCPQLYGDQPDRAMSDGRFDGLIWYSALTSPSLAVLDSCTVPVVLIHDDGEGLRRRRPSVMCDNAQGIRLAVEYLAELGHRRIAFLIDACATTGDGWQRREGFRDALDALGLPYRRERDLILVEGEEDYDAFLRRPDRPTGVVCWSDGAAAFLLGRAAALGVDVPRELSVVGFDSTSFCDELRPALTSVSQPLVVMGRTAVDLLVQSISGEATDPPVSVLPCGLDVRGSTAQPFDR